MTAIVGILCKNGVVIGTDGAITFTRGPQPTIEQPTEKIDIIGNSVILAATGEVGLAQRFSWLLQKCYENKLFSKAKSGHELEIVKHISRSFIEDMSHTYIKPGLIGALIAFVFDNRPVLCEFDITNFQPELKTSRSAWYCSMGSAQTILDPFLGFLREIFWKEGLPNLHEGIFSVVWALHHAILVNPGGVNEPIQIAILEKSDEWMARRLSQDELEEHRQMVEEIKQHLRNFKERFKSSHAPEFPIP